MPVLRRTGRPRGAHLPPRERVPPLTPDARTRHRLENEPLEVVGRILDSSNLALLVRAGEGPDAPHAIYKPVSGERPLWDFPDGCLAFREVAAHLIDAAGGWDVVPLTVLRDGPFGVGSVQEWVTASPTGDDDDDGGGDGTPFGMDLEEEDLDDDGDDPDEGVVRLFAPAEVPRGWLAVLHGELGDGSPVAVAHADTPQLRSVAVLDAVLNNSDRKGSHLLTALDGRLRGIDHGVTLHEDDKLRTVLWGWAGAPLPAAEIERLGRLRTGLAEPPTADVLEQLLTVAEIEALHARIERLLATGRHPTPSPGWPAVPWPPL